MPSADVLDFAKLLAPIPGDSPTGIDLRADPSPVSTYQLIKEDRKAARQLETRIDRGEPDLPLPEWRPLLEKARQVLIEQSKDLEVCAYLIEALVRLHGFAGMRDGFRLARELVETSWEGLYPAPDDSDVESRFSHILQLNGVDSTGALIVPIAKIPFTERTSLGQFSKVDYQAAQSLTRIGDPKARQARIDGGAVSMEMIQRAIGETPSKFYTILMDDLTQSLDEFQSFCAALKDRSGYDPPSGNIREALESYRDVVKDLARPKLASAAKAAPAPDGEASAAPAATAAGAAAVEAASGPTLGSIQNRSDALDKILRIADYFRETEPQSIIPYALEQVVHWGHLSLPELLTELISEEAPRKGLFKQVGIKPPEPPPKEAKAK